MKSFIFALLITATQTFAATSASKMNFVKPQDKEVVPTTFPVEFAVTGMTIEKAGVMKKGTGHHHLIIDGSPIPAGKSVPKNETHIHYGDGSFQTNLNLKPGTHTLTLQFADGSHISYGPEYSKTITITVK